MCERCIEAAIDAWDAHVARWLEDGRHDLGAPALLAAYRAPEALHRAALPEPYVGDPREPGLAVMVNLNPGREIAEQRRGGSFFAAVEQAGYHAAVRRWKVARATADWWWGRSRWPARLLGVRTPPRPPALFGLDIFPWHSRTWDGVTWDAASKRWVVEHVLRVAGSAAARSVLGRARVARGGRPVVLAVGKAVHDALPPEAIRATSLHTGPMRGWPLTAAGSPVTRTFALHHVRVAEPDGAPLDFDLLVTWAPGGNTPPQEGFDPIVREVLEIR